MRSRYRISVGGVQMDTLDDNLLILDIAYPPPTFTANRNKAANVAGYEPDDEYLEQNSVTVTFELHIYDVAERNAVCQKVNEWARAGGDLKTNDREGQVLRNVRCDQYASIESARNWTDPLTLVFVTTYVPYWQSDKTVKLALSGASAGGTLKMDGNTKDALVTVEAKANTSIKNFSITVGSTKLEVTDIALANNQTLNIDYVHSRYLRIRANGKSVMNKLSADSTDLLTAPCGQNTPVSYIASGKMTVSIAARGLWL